MVRLVHKEGNGQIVCSTGGWGERGFGGGKGDLKQARGCWGTTPLSATSPVVLALYYGLFLLNYQIVRSLSLKMLPFVVNMHVVGNTDRQTDRYFIDRKKVNPDLFIIEIRERYVQSMYIQHC